MITELRLFFTAVVFAFWNACNVSRSHQLCISNAPFHLFQNYGSEKQSESGNHEFVIPIVYSACYFDYFGSWSSIRFIMNIYY